jgi:hypothetical protein
MREQLEITYTRPHTSAASVGALVPGDALVDVYTSGVASEIGRALALGVVGSADGRDESEESGGDSEAHGDWRVWENVRVVEM